MAPEPQTAIRLKPPPGCKVRILSIEPREQHTITDVTLRNYREKVLGGMPEQDTSKEIGNCTDKPAEKEGCTDKGKQDGGNVLLARDDGKPLQEIRNQIQPVELSAVSSAIAVSCHTENNNEKLLQNTPNNRSKLQLGQVPDRLELSSLIRNDCIENDCVTMETESASDVSERSMVRTVTSETLYQCTLSDEARVRVDTTSSDDCESKDAADVDVPLEGSVTDTLNSSRSEEDDKSGQEEKPEESDSANEECGQTEEMEKTRTEVQRKRGKKGARQVVLTEDELKLGWTASDAGSLTIGELYLTVRLELLNHII